jgi:hypothetical protein
VKSAIWPRLPRKKLPITSLRGVSSN